MRIQRTSTAILSVFVITTALQAEVQTKTVPYEHDGVKLEGFLAWDDSVQGKRPGVLVVHEWWGLDDYARRRARQLARAGYVAFALDMYGKGKLTEHPQQAREWSGMIRENVDQWRERALAGLEILKRQEQTDDSRLAAIGYCFGGSTVLQMALGGADLKGVASFHGGLFEPNLEEVRNAKAAMLICHGAVDAFIPEETAQKFRQALEKGGADYTMIYYGGAHHSFTVPAADQRDIENIDYHPKAARRSWRHLRVFLREVFRNK